MKNNLKEDILNTCRGYEREYIMSTLREIVSENSAATLREHYCMQVCPVCGCEDVHITNVMRGIGTGRQPVIVAKMGFCTRCKHHSHKVFKDSLPDPVTEAIWMKEAVRVWNEEKVVSFFKVCEDTFGADYQYACNSEEIFELIEALTRYGKLTSRDQRPDRRQDNSSIVSEMADVIICIYQLLYTRKVSPNVLDAVIKEKIQRTCNNESVRTAILELSRKITEASLIHAPIAGKCSSKPT